MSDCISAASGTRLLTGQEERSMIPDPKGVAIQDLKSSWQKAQKVFNLWAQKVRRKQHWYLGLGRVSGTKRWACARSFSSWTSPFHLLPTPCCQTHSLTLPWSCASQISTLDQRHKWNPSVPFSSVKSSYISCYCWGPQDFSPSLSEKPSLHLKQWILPAGAAAAAAGEPDSPLPKAAPSRSGQAPVPGT